MGRWEAGRREGGLEGEGPGRLLGEKVRTQPRAVRPRTASRGIRASADGPGDSDLTAASPLPPPPPNLPKLLREEEKKKYTEMAREWRAVHRKDPGLAKNQVKLGKSSSLPGALAC